ncbi:hypothetical protein [Kribbella monticola]|uniref:hypothetical protein n=1 Tax=Kribbella monticola TaxID=2185285 RepID=UPI001300B525|nr:hypothetical protein [Kribbella monticola]
MPDEIEVRTAPDGAVVIGPEPVGAAGLVFVALTDGVLVVDPMAPHNVPQLRLTGEPAEATESLFGTAVAGRARGVDVPAPELVASPERDALVRLGILRWLHERSPVSLDLPLVVVEQLALEAGLTELLDPEHHAPLAILDWVPALIEWSGRARGTDSDFRRTAEVAEVILDGLRTAELQLESGGRLHSDVVHEIELLTAISAWGLSGADPDGAWAVLDELRPQPADDLGHGDLPSWHGNGPVDWDRTPPRATARHEEAVSWSIRGGALSVVVDLFPPAPHAAVLAAPAAAADRPGRLQATLYASSWPLPLASIDLELRAESGAWMGTHQLDPAVLQHISRVAETALFIDVHARGTRHRAPIGPAADRASAARWAARGLSALRLAAAGRSRAGLLSTASQALTRAATFYSGLPDGVGGPEARQCRALAQWATGGGTPLNVWRPNGSAEADTPPVFDPVGGPAGPSAAEVWYAADAPRSE